MKSLYYMDWIECFWMYIAIIFRSAPHRVADLIRYQSLIISASQNRHEGCWTIYNRRLRLKASATKNTEWSAYDNTMCFPILLPEVISPGPNQSNQSNSMQLWRTAHPAQSNPTIDAWSVWTGTTIQMDAPTHHVVMSTAATGASTTPG